MDKGDFLNYDYESFCSCSQDVDIDILLRNTTSEFTLCTTVLYKSIFFKWDPLAKDAKGKLVKYILK